MSYRLAQREEIYKNFRRNILGSCIDTEFYERNDHLDDKNKVHNAFDFGFLSALAKIKYEMSVQESRLINNEIDMQAFLSEIKELISERMEIAYCKNSSPIRGSKIEKLIGLNEMRISDDL